MIEFATFRVVIRDALLILIGLMHLGQNVTLGVKPPPPPAAVPMPSPPPPSVFVLPPTQPSPPSRPQTLENAEKATVRLYNGDSQCTATILQDRPGPGRYWAISAAHCVKGGVRNGSLKLSDGRTYPFRVARISAVSDLALLEFDGPEGLPYARIAATDAKDADSFWTCGYGKESPGVRRTGTLTNITMSNGFRAFKLAVSPGDSGAGIFRSDNGQLVAVVSARSGGTCIASGLPAIRRLVGEPPGET